MPTAPSRPWWRRLLAQSHNVLIYAPSLRFEALGANSWAWLMVAILVVLQLGFTYLPPAQWIFGTTGLSAMHWLLIPSMVPPLMLLVELEKWWCRRKLRG